jgi:plasmid maintenance system antidote protein VapI
MADRLLPKRVWPSCYPGEVLAEEFVTPYGLSALRLAKQFSHVH